MTSTAPRLLESENLSIVWAQAFLNTYCASKYKARHSSPLVVSLAKTHGELPVEDSEIRNRLDAALSVLGKNATRVSALVIFPFDPWQRRGRAGVVEFSRFCIDRLLPRLKRRDRRNRLGTYFERMMNYSGQHRGRPATINQLEFVISLLRGTRRRPRQSALQITCFDPLKDDTRQPVRGFPCLHQIGVTLDDQGDFSLNAYYPTQYIFDRGYGNYLGLCHLGAFIAHQTGLRFVRLNCFVGRPVLGDVSKADLSELAAFVTRRLGIDPRSFG